MLIDFSKEDYLKIQALAKHQAADPNRKRLMKTTRWPDYEENRFEDIVYAALLYINGHYLKEDYDEFKAWKKTQAYDKSMVE